jgi:hypothetical protein
VFERKSKDEEAFIHFLPRPEHRLHFGIFRLQNGVARPDPFMEGDIEFWIEKKHWFT